MEQIVVAAVLLAVAVVVATLVRRRKPDVPSAPARYTVPTQLDRADFDRPLAPWLVVVFSSRTCLACAGTWEKAALLESADVAVQEVEASERRDIHERYRIDGVPLVVIADLDGVVRASFVGPPTATDLWATVAELRDPGSVPEGCEHGQGDAGAG